MSDDSPQRDIRLDQIALLVADVLFQAAVAARHDYTYQELMHEVRKIAARHDFYEEMSPAGFPFKEYIESALEHVAVIKWHEVRALLNASRTWPVVDTEEG